jgi:hypothetical protein
MIKEIELSIPTDWSGITLKKYLVLQQDLKSYEDDEEAMVALMMSHLCGLDAEYLHSIPVDTYNQIRETLTAFISQTEHPLQKIIRIDGKEYGFEPNLSQLSYGAYLDISKYQTMTIDDNWASIMSILYRPVLDKKGDMYHIAPYTGKIDSEKFLGLGMDIHFGALFFFVNLSMDLLNAILNSLKVEGIPPNIKSILEKSGEVTRRLLNLQTEMS